MLRTLWLRNAAFLPIALLAFQTDSHAREITFERRVAAQAAIERVYYAHQIGATRSFAQAVPREVLERKVRTYLGQSLALERLWRTPVTAEMLERELDRIAERTRMPERLRELFAALGDDPLLVQECLVRPILVARLARSSFAFDPQIHEEARRDAERIRQALLDGRLDPLTEDPARTVSVLVRIEEAAPARYPVDDEGRRRIELGPRDFARERSRVPRGVGAIGSVRNEREAYAVRVVLDERPDGATIATYRFPKRTWHEWWSEVGYETRGTAVAVVARADRALPSLTTRDDERCPADRWDNGILDDLPPARSDHCAVSIGSRMIVWGGVDGGYETSSGLTYDPATDSWSVISTVDAPSSRRGHNCVWADDELIVWGGGGGYMTNTGGRYDPVSDTWSPTSLTDAPEGRWGATAVWSGEAMIVWGGYPDFGDPFDTGGRYDPVSDTWSATSTAGAAQARGSHRAVWGGDRMLIWGGYNDGFLKTGGAYDPLTDSWTPIDDWDAPSPRTGHSAVWSGNEMIVWGGYSPGEGYVATGARYHPPSDYWTATQTVGAPEGRTGHTTVWTGNEMIVWGSQYGEPTDGARYDPMTDSWATVSSVGAPERRSRHSAVWVGDRMIVWGGDTYEDGYRQLATGGRYDPVSNSWDPTYAPGAPWGRYYHTAVWTGNEMIVWGGGYWTGGDGPYIESLGTGGRYSPLTDDWSPTSQLNAPDDRFAHTAVWSGNHMVVWGGTNGVSKYASGGRYDPISDTWAATSIVGAPAERRDHTAVWTGSEMIVWGGDSYATGANGGRYLPAIDLWGPMSSVNGPSHRILHTAVWADDAMIVWGGSWQGNSTHTGGRYDPVGDTWTPTSTTGAPTARDHHGAVWDGDRMIVWGGYDDRDATDTGGRYHPATDSWTPTSLESAPSARGHHASVWVDDLMVVWGGGADDSDSRYDPIGDRWLPISYEDAPSKLTGRTAVAAGDWMMVWGGAGPLNDGGRYRPNGTDRDGDGHGCGADCDDEDPTVFAKPVRVTDLRFGPKGERLQWISAAPGAGSGTVYDIVRGLVSELPVGSGPSETCVESEYSPPPGPDLTIVEWTEEEAPTSGTAFWYLVRPENSCGQGDYGVVGLSLPRETLACP